MMENLPENLTGFEATAKLQPKGAAEATEGRSRNVVVNNNNNLKTNNERSERNETADRRRHLRLMAEGLPYNEAERWLTQYRGKFIDQALSALDTSVRSGKTISNRTAYLRGCLNKLSVQGNAVKRSNTVYRDGLGRVLKTINETETPEPGPDVREQQADMFRLIREKL